MSKLDHVLNWAFMVSSVLAIFSLAAYLTVQSVVLWNEHQQFMQASACQEDLK